MADIEKNDAAVTLPEDDKAKDKAAKAKKEKISIFKRIGKFFRECRSEIKKIVWYGREQTFRSSVLVIVCIIIVGVIVAALDFAFSRSLIWLGTLI